MDRDRDRDRDRRRSPQLETLEGKLLLSSAHASPAVLARQAQMMLSKQGFSLAGTLQMPTTSLTTITTTTGQNIGTFTLHGRLGTMGQVNGSFVALLDGSFKYMTSGELRLTNRLGTVYLKMANDPTSITAYDWSVDYGTDAYVNAVGSGKMATGGVTNAGRIMLFNLTQNK